MSERFAPRAPCPASWGFEAGVIRIAWARTPSYSIHGREGSVWIATITEIHTDQEMLPSAMVTAALVGMIVRAPDGALSRITGVEAHCTTNQCVGATLGLLLVPVEGDK